MSGISSSVGLISGINSGQIIEQLLAIEARPKTLIQRRITELQRQQAGVLDLTSRLDALKVASAKFNASKIFRSAAAVSSNPDALSATASNGAPAGSYTFLVDRTVSTQQLLSRAYSDRNSTSIGATSLTVESTRARLDSDTELAQLNSGQGLSRGKIVITDRAGTSATVDLTRAASVSEVLRAINTNGTARITASVSGGQFVLTDSSGGSGSLSVRSESGYSTAESLGLAQSVSASTITGSSVYRIGDGTTLASLNDGSGIRFSRAAGNGSFDFTIQTRDGTTSNIDISDLYNGTGGARSAGPVATVSQLRQRIAEQTDNKVQLNVRADGRGFELVDTTTGTASFAIADFGSVGAAQDLGIVGSTTGNTITGTTVLAGLNSTLATTINAGQGVRDNTLNITGRDGTVFNLTLDTSGSFSDILNAISSGTGNRIRASLGQNGTSVVLTDTFSGTATSNLIISGGLAGSSGLNIETAPAGVASNTVTGTRITRQYVTQATQLTQLNAGSGIGSGTFAISGANGVRALFTVGTETRTVGDVISLINSKTSETGVIARINDTGSGIVVEEQSPGAGGAKISITDDTGTVARTLNLAGTASGTGVDNKIDGSFRRTIAFEAGDSLDTIVTKITAARAGVTANIVSDGTSSTPFRLQLSAARSGSDGRQLFEFAGADLGLNTIADGDNARVFYGSSDPARAILLSRPTNSFDGVVSDLRVDARASNANPITVTVSRDGAAIETAVQEFVTAYNALSTRIGQLTDYDQETDTRGALLGDGTTNTLRLELSRVVSGPAQSVSGQFRFLSQVGVTVGQGGQLSVNTTRLQAAIAQDAQGVADLFAAKVENDRPTTRRVLDDVDGITTLNTDPVTYSSLGVAERLVQLADRYLATVGGTLTGKRTSIDDQISRNNDRITAFDARLSVRRTTLERQYANLESVLAQLQRQQSSLSRINPIATTTR
jgi:flagellar hook-associated protein 2